MIAQTGLLSFISRHHLDTPEGRSPLKEVAIKKTTMHRRPVVTHRESSYLMPAARMLITLLQDTTRDGGRVAAVPGAWLQPSVASTRSTITPDWPR